ncbi:hypothetical protein NKR23_g3209 [Pleurostoma richardsiae]|uniref:Uncharacterized protein n=1 Tax=Pleurostoma richardsiae TaxID=41990 RepID=A0AA38RVB4_9PEZI|nr:hypothetical protein NKR23_g3209 [Pleurostoma richardsiae]
MSSNKVHPHNPKIRISWKRGATTPSVNGRGSGSDPGQPPARRATDIIYQPVWVNGQEMTQVSVRAYNLSWEKLRNWLLRVKYKDYTGLPFEEDNWGLKDRFFFCVPVDTFTEVDKLAIDALRDKSSEAANWVADRRTHSPERRPVT